MYGRNSMCGLGLESALSALARRWRFAFGLNETFPLERAAALSGFAEPDCADSLSCRDVLSYNASHELADHSGRPVSAGDFAGCGRTGTTIPSGEERPDFGGAAEDGFR